MAERGFQTELWTDPFIQELPPEAKLLFIYLWTNKHCNQAGLYEITMRTIAFDTGLPQESLPVIMKQLEPKVAWYPEQNLVWVKNFLKRQCKSDSFLVAAAKALRTVRNDGLVAAFVKYNQGFNLTSLLEGRVNTALPQSHHGVDTVSPHPPYSGDTVYNPVPVPNPDKEKGIVKGERAGETIPRSRLEAEETLCEGDQEIISTWCSVKGFDMSPADASALVARLRTEFPDLDLLAESKTWAARKLSEPLKKGSRPSQQIWNWMRLARKYAQERRDRERKSATGEPRRQGMQASGTNRRYTQEPTDEQYRRSLPTRQRPSAK